MYVCLPVSDRQLSRPTGARRIASGIVLTALLPALALAQAPPPAAFPGAAPPTGPPAEILRFVAEPMEIQPGESALLRWEAINTFSLILAPNVGAVATRGTMRVSPEVSTTYVLTATGTGGARSGTLTVTVAGTTPPAAQAVGAERSPAEAPADLPIPRFADGRPDLSGLYIGGRDIRLVESVRLRPGAEPFRIDAGENDLGVGVDCLPPGVPGATLMPFPLQIVHKPDVLAIMYEAYHLFRIIPIGREHSEYLDPAWMGHSVARWDGDTLVVEVVGFNDRTVVAGHRHTEAMRVVERYRRTSYDAISYEATVEDPNVFAAPIRYAGELTLRPEWEIGEYVCLENNKDYDALFGD
jgi:hypothetical protein